MCVSERMEYDYLGKCVGDIAEQAGYANVAVM